MTVRPELVHVDVDGARLGALRWPSERPGAPIVVAIHGITANAWHWDTVAHRLGGEIDLVAVDLRGRGRSFEQPPPFGMRQHADDIARVIEQLGRPAAIVAHSMGCYVALMASERHPDAVTDLVLVDGGARIPVPDGADVDEVLDQTLGPAIDRLRTTWPDRVSYYSMWTQHPAFAEGISTNLERNLLADLIEVDGGFRTAVAEEAVRIDGRELGADDDVRSLLERRTEPTTIIRAPDGLMGAPPPLIPAEIVGELDHHRWETIDGTNHYTMLLGARGAAVVADRLRSIVAITGSGSRP